VRRDILEKDEAYKPLMARWKEIEESAGKNGEKFEAEMARYRDEPAGSNFNFVNSALWIAGPPWTGTPAWNDTRVTALAYSVPKLNAKALRNIGGGVPTCLANSSPLATDNPSWVTQCTELGQWGFRGPHPGGVNFLFADGSVKFLKDTVNLATYRALSTRAMGEVVSADAY